MIIRMGVLLSLVVVLCALPACTSVEREDLKAFNKEANEEHQSMSKMEEANLDDNLDPVERKAVDKVFKNNRKETERMEKTIF